MPESLQDWFKREIVVHEPALVRFIRRAWPDASEVEDIRQEVYIRVYESAAQSIPTAPKSFLFATTRHLLVDRIRRNRIVSIEVKGDLDALNVLVDERSPERQASAREEFLRLAGAFEALPMECREVVWLRKVERLTQSDVSKRLGVPARTIEKRVARGIRLLARVVFGADPAQDFVTEDRKEHERG
jgi:RNA polymerase sigma factor (sigma-70 family)